MGWGQSLAPDGCGTTAQIEAAHGALDAMAVPRAHAGRRLVLVERVLGLPVPSTTATRALSTPVAGGFVP